MRPPVGLNAALFGSLRGISNVCPSQIRAFAKLSEELSQDSFREPQVPYLFKLPPASPTSDSKVQQSWLPWRRELSFWEKFYWVAGLSAVLYGSYRYHASLETLEQKEVREAKEQALAAQRLQYMRDILAGCHFLDGSDPFQGLAPGQIQGFVEANRKELEHFEGLSPEEIDELMCSDGGTSQSQPMRS